MLNLLTPLQHSVRRSVPYNVSRFFATRSLTVYEYAQLANEFKHAAHIDIHSVPELELDYSPLIASMPVTEEEFSFQNETLLSNPTRLSPTDEWIKESTLTSFFGPLFATDRPYRGIRKDALDHGDNEHWKAPALEAETETESLSIPNPYN